MRTHRWSVDLRFDTDCPVDFRRVDIEVFAPDAHVALVRAGMRYQQAMADPDTCVASAEVTHTPGEHEDLLPPPRVSEAVGHPLPRWASKAHHALRAIIDGAPETEPEYQAWGGDTERAEVWGGEQEHWRLAEIARRALAQYDDPRGREDA